MATISGFLVFCLFGQPFSLTLNDILRPKEKNVFDLTGLKRVKFPNPINELFKNKENVSWDLKPKHSGASSSLSLQVSDPQGLPAVYGTHSF